MGKLIKIGALFAGVCLLSGLTVYLTLSLMIDSEKTVIVPDLAGKDIVSALELLTQMGLDTKIDGSEYDPSIPKNHIVYQDPEAGAEIKRGRDIRLVISKGTQTVFLPNLVSQTLQQGQVILKRNDLCVEVISHTHSDLLGKDRIIAMDPIPGTSVDRGACVALLVSMGPRPVYLVMPDLGGIPLDDAISRIETHGLQLGTVSAVVRPGQPLDTIAEQDPPAGHRVQQGAAIRLTINRTADNRQRDPAVLQAGVRLFRHRLPVGFLKKRMRARVDCFGMSLDLVDELVRPGSEIWVLIPRNVDAALFLYENDALIQTRVFDAW